MDNKPICVKCNRRYQPLKNGVYVKVLNSKGDFYYMVMADELMCPVCKHKIVFGFGNKALFYNHELNENTGKSRQEYNRIEFNEVVIEDKG